MAQISPPKPYGTPYLAGLFFLLVLALLSGCKSAPGGSLPTPIPPGYLPTAIALTVEAGSAKQVAAHVETGDKSSAGSEISAASQTPNGNPIIESSSEVEITSTASQESISTPTPSPTLAPATPTATTHPAWRPPTATVTPTPEVPVADIQIFKPGDLSRVASPIHLAGYLRPGYKGRVWIELFGEDGRLLYREIKVFNVPAGAKINLSMDLGFEIASVAEVGRLVVSVKDEDDRLESANSVNLILLSMGESDINPSDALLDRIDIRQPYVKTLIQGGKVLVSGLARTDTGLPLRVELVDPQGKVVGQRLATVSTPGEGGYGQFAVEVPYTVTSLTPVRLIVYEDGESVSPVVHLSSLEVQLSP